MAVDLGQVHFRLGDEKDRVDRYVDFMHKTTGLTVTRTDAVRALVSKALDAHEAEQSKKGGRK